MNSLSKQRTVQFFFKLYWWYTYHFKNTYSPITLGNISSINLVSIFRCSSSPSNPVYVRRVDFSDLVFSLSSYRLSYRSCSQVSFSWFILNTFLRLFFTSHFLVGEEVKGVGVMKDETFFFYGWVCDFEVIGSPSRLRFTRKDTVFVTWRSSFGIDKTGTIEKTNIWLSVRWKFVFIMNQERET